MAEAALVAYLEPARDEDELILRRTDKLEDAIAAVRDDLKVLGHAVAQQARVTLLAAACGAPR